jgi:DNA-binding transcriptional LysR family regulator
MSQLREAARVTPRFDLHSLRLFARVVELKNIARAAEAEHIAPSALSKRISDLEASLETSLLYRQRRGVDPTPAGLALLHHAREILASVGRLELDMAEYAAGVRGHVRMLANISSIIQFLPADLSSFSRDNPQIKVDLREASSPSIFQAVAGGAADLGVVVHYADEGRSPSLPELNTRPYRSDQLVLVVPNGHPLAAQSIAAFAEALAFDFVGLHADSGWESLIASAARAMGEQVRMRIRVPSFDAVARMVESDLGISIVPINAIRTELAGSRLRAIPLSDAWAHRTLDICFRDFDSLPVTARLLVDHLTVVSPDV